MGGRKERYSAREKGKKKRVRKKRGRKVDGKMKVRREKGEI